MLLLTGRTGEAWEPSKKQYSYGNIFNSSTSFLCCTFPAVNFPSPYLLNFPTRYLYQKDERALFVNLQQSGNNFFSSILAPY
jgi:hypothetical protein